MKRRLSLVHSTVIPPYSERAVDDLRVARDSDAASRKNKLLDFVAQEPLGPDVVVPRPLRVRALPLAASEW